MSGSDVLPIVDISDTTDGSTGTTKQVTFDNLLKSSLPADDRTVSTIGDYLGNNAVFNVRDYGAVGDTTTNDHAALQAAADAASAAATNTGLTNCAPILLFPFCDGYATDQTITVGANVSVRMEGQVIYTGTDDVPVIDIGGAGSAAETTAYRYHLLNTYRKTASDWSSEDNIGVRLWNHIGCHIDVHNVQRNTIGLQLLSDADGFLTGCAYNKVFLRSILDNQIGVDLTNQNGGFTNENVFIGGRFALNSAISSQHPTTERYGVRITSIDGEYAGNNSNVFLKPSFELGSSYGIGILIETGGQNYVYRGRNEANLYAMRCTGSTANNVFEAAYDDGACGGLDDQSSLGGNSYRWSQGNIFPLLTREVFRVSNVAGKYAPYNATNINVEGMAFLTSSGPVKNSTGVTVGEDYLQLSSGTSQVLGVLVDTRVNKEFLLAMVSKSATGGRFTIQCYDADGNVLTDEAEDYPVVKPIGTGAPWTYNSARGGAYGTGIDSPLPRYVKFKDVVKSAFMGVSGGTNANQLQGFAIYTRGVPGFAPTSLLSDYSAPQVTPGHGGSPNRAVHQSPQTSAIGTWAVGDYLPADNAAPGSPIGYVCTTAGSPGTWTAIYLPEATASGGAVATTASTQTTPYGYTTQAQADGIVTLLNTIRTALVDVGILS